MAQSTSQSTKPVHILGLTVKKSADINKWYQQVVTKGQLIAYTDVSGCYVLLPNAYGIWENIVQHLDREFKARAVKNCYFPLFITDKNLTRESAHLEGFKPEVAWVTKSGDTKLKEPLAVRPTSECAIYPVLPNLIKSYQDLPLRLNQWCNVVRWEFKDPTPFIRSREFLWQEGHIAYATPGDALRETVDMIKLYRDVYETVLAIPMIMGKKTAKETFAGADSTYTVETFIPEAGKGIQAATAHFLGQNFSKMFDITFQDADKQIKHVWQNSWGFTTRSIGIMLMMHGDDKGPIIPPAVAATQLIIIPIHFKKDQAEIMDYAQKVYRALRKSFRVEIDTSTHRPGWKYSHWETLGVPLRVEVGPRDLKNGTISLCRRDTGEKLTLPFDDTIKTIATIDKLFIDIRDELFKRASARVMACLVKPNTYSQFKQSLVTGRMCLIPWCDQQKCEEAIKDDTGAKSLCIPIDQFELGLDASARCLKCGAAALVGCLFGRSY